MSEKLKYAPIGELSAPEARALVLECDGNFDMALEAQVAKICESAPKGDKAFRTDLLGKEHGGQKDRGRARKKRKDRSHGLDRRFLLRQRNTS